MGYSQLLFSNEAYIRSEVKQGVLSALVGGKIRASQNVSQSRNRHKILTEQCTSLQCLSSAQGLSIFQVRLS